MERLTHRYMGGTAWASIYKVSACGENECTGPIIGRLAAYEEAMPLERAQELAQAEKDGRLVVLPCKVGDTVYVTYGEGYKPCVVDRIHIIANNQVQVRLRYFCTETLWLSAPEFGKTVFLTREEAEAALKKREEADDEAD